MNGTTREFKFNCFMDESFDSNESTTRNYIISASIYLGNIEEGFSCFLEHGLELGFKTSRKFNLFNQKFLYQMGRWLKEQDFMSFTSVVSLEKCQPEVARRIGLMELLNQLNLLGVDTFHMDSRDNLKRKGGSLNYFDISTLSYLTRMDSRFRGSQILFEEDQSDFRFAIADYIAWSTRRVVSANDHRFYEFFENSNYLYKVHPEKNEAGIP
jgi:hypothetical protein